MGTGKGGTEEEIGLIFAVTGAGIRECEGGGVGGGGGWESGALLLLIA